MKHRSRWIKTSLVTSLGAVLALPLLALSGPGGHGRGPSFSRMIERNADELGIDAATLERIQAIEARQADQTKALRTSLRKEREALHALLEQDRPDQSLVLNQADVLGELRTSMQKQQLTTLLEIRAVLTPEQIQALADMRQKRRERFKDRRGFGRRGRGGPPPEMDDPAEG